MSEGSRYASLLFVNVSPRVEVEERVEVRERRALEEERREPLRPREVREERGRGVVARISATSGLSDLPFPLALTGVLGVMLNEVVSGVV
jgi:hypothetical protein